MSGLQDSFADRVEWILLDFDDSSWDNKRSELGITAQAQYVLVNADGAIVGRWFGLLNEMQVAAEIENLLQS